MKDKCSLIATLPNLNHKDKIHKILSNYNVIEARYNTGASSLMTTEETLSILKSLSEQYSKDIWLDLKGRQLRITKWADPLYEAIELNHNIDIAYPAKVLFRNGGVSNIVRTRGNKIIVDPPPRQALGAGQSINILAKDLEIEGYLTPKDIEFLNLCNQFEFNKIMASFVECEEDFEDIKQHLPNAEIIAKIESLKGMKLIIEKDLNYNLMAARDDLYIQTEGSIDILKYLKLIIEKNKDAICASRIFSSLERQNKVDLADYSDLELMYQMGYRNFMLCDNICNYHFDDAIEAWKGFSK